jgi:hypothetical protein
MLQRLLYNFDGTTPDIFHEVVATFGKPAAIALLQYLTAHDEAIESLYEGSEASETGGLETRRRGPVLRAEAAAASRLAVSLSAASFANRSARKRAVFSASVWRKISSARGVWASPFFFDLNCPSARRRPASLRTGWESMLRPPLQADDLTGRHSRPGILLPPVSSGVFNRRPVCRGAPDTSPRFLSRDDGMIPRPVVSHWALDRKRFLVLIGDD